MNDDPVSENDQQLWDKQMDLDATTGHLDFLREEAKAEGGGFPKDWPSA
jgi:hypothetical protein